MPVRFLAILAAVLLAGCAPDRGPVPASTSASIGGVQFRQLAPGVWMHSSWQDVAGFGRVVSHGLLVVEGKRSRLIDTGWNDEQTDAILRFAETSLGAPVAEAVFTHAHSDKMGGVGILRRRGVATYALTLSNRRAPVEGVPPAEHDLTLAAGGAAQAFGSVQLFWPGAGHTPDNIVVWLPETRILFGGCLIRPGDSDDLGNTGDADIAHWDDAVVDVKSRFGEARTVIPSHGDPGGPALLDHTIALARSAG